MQIVAFTVAIVCLMASATQVRYPPLLPSLTLPFKRSKSMESHAFSCRHALKYSRPETKANVKHRRVSLLLVMGLEGPTENKIGTCGTEYN